MIRVMIVDDERIVRDDLKTLIDWKDHGYRIVAEAGTGVEGLRQFRLHRPEIIITDIRMPVMDGIQMIRQLQEEGHQPEAILLTAYGDFAYAQEAIKLGIHSYLLKHEMDRPSLLQELDKWRQKRSMKLTYEEFREEGELKKAVSGHGHQRSVFMGECRLCLIQMDDRHAYESNPLRYGQAVRDAVSEWRSGTGKEAVLAETGDARYTVLLRETERSSRGDRTGEAVSLIRLIQARVKADAGGTASAAIGSAFEGEVSIQGAYFALQRQLDLAFFHDGAALIMPASRPGDEARRTRETDARGLLEEAEGLLRQRSFHEADRVIERLLTVLLPSAGSLELAEYAVHLLSTRLKVASASPTYPDSFREEVDDILRDSANRNVFAWRRSMGKCLELLEDEFRAYSAKIKKALDYIRKYYAQDIPLDKIADHMGVTPVYASQLFKKEVGVTFVEYLTQYRIGQARALLETGRYKIYEVSVMVGYATVSYFCKQYKKITGSNPTER